MNTHAKIICLLCIAAITHWHKAQGQDLTLLSTSGGLSSSFNLFLSYSIGEPCITYTQNGNTWITEGFQQPGHMDIAVSTDPINPQTNLSVFPNPFATTITISGESLNTCYDLRMVNPIGQIVFEKRISSEMTQTMDMGHLPPGLYVLTLRCRMSSFFSQTIIKL